MTSTVKKRVLFLADVYNYGKRHEFQLQAIRNSRSDEEVQAAIAGVPHGVLYGVVLLATILQNAGIDVEILECAFHPFQRKRLLEKLKEKPAIVCITTTFFTDADAMRARVASVRQHCPEAKLIFGGPTLIWNEAMRDLADICVMGEGDEVILPLVQRLLRNESINDLPNVAFKKSDETWQTNPTQLMKSMDENPTPNWALLNRNSDDCFMLATQRGCKWRCAFCTYPANEGWKLRYRSVESLVAEVKDNYRKFGIFRYMFADSTFTHPHDRCLRFLREIAELPFKVEWMAYARVDNVTEELAEAMAKSGCKGLFLGIESGDDRILKRMNKGFQVERVRNACELLRKYKIPITASWIIGFPDENKETLRNTLRLILELNAEHNLINTFSVYDTSPLGYRPEHFGVKGWGSEWTHKTMNSRRATRWTSFVSKKMHASGVSQGSLFDFIWISSIGYSSREAVDFFKKIQMRSADLQLDDLRPQLDAIYLAARRHPIYANVKSPLLGGDQGK
ncbi:MAG: B12-binding domain-containing radical SAM protein [Bdellovibrionota bacterium]